MRLIDIAATASSNMLRSKLRTFLTIVAIFIGSFTLTLTNGLGSGIASYIDREVGNFGAADALIIQAAGDSTGLPTDDAKKYDPSRRTTSIESEGNRTVTVLTDADLAQIRRLEGIKSAEAYQSAVIDYVAAAGSDKYVASIEPYLDGANYALDAGRQPKSSTDAFEILIPSTYLKFLGFNSAAVALGHPVSLGITNGLGQQSEVGAKVVGVKQKSLAGGVTLNANPALLAQLRTIHNIGLPPAVTASFQVAVARFDASMSDYQLTQLKGRLTKVGYKGTTIQDQIGTFKSVINGIVLVLNGFAVIALLAAGFGIINTLLMSVQERTKEIGLMKAMGMSAGRIFLLFSGEAVLLGFWGSLLGSIAAIGAGSVINQIVLQNYLKDLVGLQLLTFSVVSVASIMGIVMVVAFLAGTLPALRAARQSPIDSLRYE